MSRDTRALIDQVQAILDLLPTSAALLEPLRDGDGRVVDYCIEAASPAAVDIAGRRGRELVGLRILEGYPTIADGPVWAAYLDVLTTGATREVGPFTHTEVVEGVPAETGYTVRVSRLDTMLLITWIEHEEERRHLARIAQTERLGKLGWGEWDLLIGEATYSEQLYAILGLDQAAGPLAMEDFVDLVAAEDRPRVREAFAALVERGKLVDVEYRIRAGDDVRHVRSIAEASVDAAGRPLKLYGIVQDVTARWHLAEVELDLAEERRSLAIEQELTLRLQRIILPQLPDPVDLPGLRLAVRYVPAEDLTAVGGDWYHADAQPDGRILLAIGDVAGHGLEAAATMAQLRHALIALTAITTDPAALLTFLNRVMHDHTETISTAVVASYDPAEHRLTWAQAGHPAPLVVRRGRPAALERPQGIALGALRDATYDRATITLEPGDVMVTYTDGLIERRGRTLDEGLAEVVELISGAMASTRDPLGEIVARLRQANPDDDICILAAGPTR